MGPKKLMCHGIQLRWLVKTSHLFLYYETNEAIIVPKIIPTLTEAENIAVHDLIEQRLNYNFKKNGMS